MPGREITYTTNATIAQADVGYVVEANNSSTDTLYIYVPNNATIPFNQQDEIKILRSNTGPVVIQAATSTSVVINNLTSGSATIVKEFGLASLIKVGTDSWVVAGDVATGFDTSLQVFSVKVPSLSDPANIQTAFYNYHYGQPNVVTEFNNLGEESIARYLYILNQKLDAAQVGELVFTQIDSTTSLNTLNASAGFYYSPDIVNSTSTGVYAYPEQKPGILAVYKNASGGVTQTYQSFTTVVSGTGSDNIWMRSTLYNNSAAWSNWAPLAKGDITNYYTKTEINNRTLGDVSGVVLTSPSNGQTLTYNGSNWINQTPSSLGGASLYRRYVYITAGTTSTTLANLASTNTVKALRLIAVGGGGGGGQASGGGGGTYSESGGGSGGQYAEKFITSSAEIATLANIVIFVGAGGASTSNGNRSFVSTSTGVKYVEAGGGIAGTSDTAGTAGNDSVTGGSGSTLTGTGDIIINGGDGGRGTVRAGVAIGSNYGGNSILGNSVQASAANGAGNNGIRYGGGGSGASDGAGSTKAGGTGGTGIVIIEVYV